MRTALDTTTLKRFGLAAGIALAALPILAFAQDAAAPAVAAAADAATTAAAAAPAPLVPNKGDTAWMLTSTAFVLFMAVPGLALFYGGLVRSKNMLSVLMQVFVGFSLLSVLWCIYGYSFAFTAGNPFFGGTSRFFMKGIFDAATGVEAEPAEPQHRGADHAHRQAVRSQRLLAVTYALAEHECADEARDTSVDMHDGAACEVESAHLPDVAGGGVD